MAGSINNEINNLANEFLSATDLHIQQEKKLWEQKIAQQREAIEIEYSYRGQLEKQMQQTALELQLKNE
jgi:hypothetical protein